jgi:hypothetical protein
MFIFILTVSALFIAGCAAFFSIKGITLLFAGSAISVAIMASSLEIGKLVAASFLHRSWSKISISLKIYLCIAVGSLMLITSLGIFGFLTRAYEVHRGTEVAYDISLKGYDTQANVLKDELAANQVRIDNLNALRKDQEARVNAAGNYKAPREQAYKAIESANQEITGKEARQVELRKQIGELEIKKTAINSEINTKTDVGTFKFVAAAMGTNVDTAVKWFILLLVFVFDPLAVALILALNQQIEERQKVKKNENASENVAERLYKRNVNDSQHAPDHVTEHVLPKAEELKKSITPVEPIEPNMSHLPELKQNTRKNEKRLVPENNSIITIKSN